METTLTVLDGYPVHIHPGDRYAKAHLFVRGLFVHPILFTAEGQACLKEASVFTGLRNTFTADESAQLSTLYAQVQADEQAQHTRTVSAQTAQAQQTLDSRDAKVRGMDDVNIYD